MKSYLTYITEIGKGPKFPQSFPDGNDPDRFKISKYLNQSRIKPQDALPDAGFDAYTGKEIGKDPIVRPSQHLNPEIYKDVRPKKMKEMEQYIDNVRQKGLDKYYSETPLKSAMDKLDAQRSASPYHREPGTRKPPSTGSRISSIAKTVTSAAQTPVGRAAIKGLAVAGAATTGAEIGHQIQQASGLSRGLDHRDTSNRVAMQRGIEDTRTRKGVFELDLPDPFGGYDNLPYAEKRERQQELAKNIRAWEETPTTPEVTRKISPSTLEKFRTDPELERELIQNIGAAPYSDEDILRHIQRRTGARAEKQK